jgi:hypothetical protein
LALLHSTKALASTRPRRVVDILSQVRVEEIHSPGSVEGSVPSSILKIYLAHLPAALAVAGEEVDLFRNRSWSARILKSRQTFLSWMRPKA